MRSLVPFALTTTIALMPTIAHAQPVYQPVAYYCQPTRIQFGVGGSGEMISVDKCSIKKASEKSADFTYYLDNERIFAQAKCAVPKRYWLTIDDRLNPNGQPVYPQSPAAAKMLNYVCSYAGF
ncbi:MAG: hypothetical protein NW224_25875 [Leptolyngbyaceae cyanobacterium bins.302]|nr:hypothetical protein [Leptolyngbyaceae cyanobacterium bins.302]